MCSISCKTHAELIEETKLLMSLDVDLVEWRVDFLEMVLKMGVHFGVGGCWFLQMEFLGVGK